MGPNATTLVYFNFDLHGPGYEPNCDQELSHFLLEGQDRSFRPKTDLADCKDPLFEVALQRGTWSVYHRPDLILLVLTKKREPHL